MIECTWSKLKETYKFKKNKKPEKLKMETAINYKQIKIGGSLKKKINCKGYSWRCIEILFWENVRMMN